MIEFQCDLHSVYFEVSERLQSKHYGDRIETQSYSSHISRIANGFLRHGGGLAAAIARNGGPVVQEQSQAYVKKHGQIPVRNILYLLTLTDWPSGCYRRWQLAC
jgi:hypothetical protein